MDFERVKEEVRKIGKSLMQVNANISILLE
jgi:hypothetical protein